MQEYEGKRICDAYPQSFSLNDWNSLLAYKVWAWTSQGLVVFRGSADIDHIPSRPPTPLIPPSVQNKGGLDENKGIENY